MHARAVLWCYIVHRLLFLLVSLSVTERGLCLYPFTPLLSMAEICLFPNFPVIELFPTFPHQKLCSHKFPFVDLSENIVGLYCQERNRWIKGFAHMKLTKSYQMPQQNGSRMPVLAPAACESSVAIHLHWHYLAF